MIQKSSTKTVRKIDYITGFAVFLFFMIIVFELAIVVILPGQLRNKNLWEREIAFQEMIRLEDLLRAYLIDLPRGNAVHKGCTRLVGTCLDEYAAYLKQYGNNMTKEQVDELYRTLKRFETVYYTQLKHYKKPIVKPLNLNPDKYIKKLRSRALFLHSSDTQK